MIGKTGVPSSLVQAVRELEDPYFTRDEVAHRLGVSASTVADWGRRDPRLAAYGYAQVGGRRIWLYTEADVIALRNFQLARYPLRSNGMRTRRRGRPTLWAEDELRARQRRFRRAAHLKVRARQLGERGAEHQQLDLLAQASVIESQLAAQYSERFAEVTKPQIREPDWLAAQL